MAAPKVWSLDLLFINIKKYKSTAPFWNRNFGRISNMLRNENRFLSNERSKQQQLQLAVEMTRESPRLHDKVTNGLSRNRFAMQILNCCPNGVRVDVCLIRSVRRGAERLSPCVLLLDIRMSVTITHLVRILSVFSGEVWGHRKIEVDRKTSLLELHR